MNWERFQWLKHQVTTSEHHLKLEFFSCFEGRGPEKVNLESADLRAYCNFQHRLIQEVSKIHRSEISPRNTEVLKAHRNAYQALSLARDGGRGGGIYCLNDPEAVSYVVGDLHGDDIALDSLLDEIGFFEAAHAKKAFRLVFLGDYVDRGKAQLRTLVKILTLKALYPQHVVLLRGNHDGGKLCPDGSVVLAYRKETQLEDTDYFPLYLQHLSCVNSTFAADLCGAYLNLFDEFAYMALLLHGHDVWMAVHGGLPRPSEEVSESFNHLKSLYQLTDPATLDGQGRTILHNLMWSDPHRGAGRPSTTTGRFAFSEEQFQEFRLTFSITHLVRGHQRVETGYRGLFQGHCHTLFSTGDQLVQGDINGVTAYPGVAPKVLKIETDGQFDLLNI